jgi:hypothetical protein
MNTKQKALGALVGLLGLSGLVTGLRIYQSHDLQRSCDPPASGERLRELGVEMPDDIKLCQEQPNDYGVTYYVLVARTSALCVASMGAVGCPSARSEGLRWVVGMTGRGWGTGRVGQRVGSSLTYELVRPDASVTLSLYENQFSEVTGLLQVSSSRPTRARAGR